MITDVPSLVGILLVRLNRPVWRGDRLVVDRSGTAVDQAGARSNVRVELEVDMQVNRASWRRGSVLTGSRNLAIGNRDRVLAGNVLAVFQHLSTFVVNVLSKLGVVVRDGYLGQLLSQRGRIWQAHRNVSMRF